MKHKLADKDKLLVIYYLNTEKLTASQVDEMTYQIYQSLTFDDSVKFVILYTTELQSHLEVLNPKYVDKDEYDNLLRKIDKCVNNELPESKKLMWKMSFLEM